LRGTSLNILKESNLKPNLKPVIALAAFVLGFILPLAVWAHREDYIDETLVFETLEKQALETEYWLDLGNVNGSPLGFARHNISLEYGITEHWMIDTRGTMTTNGSDNYFDSGRFETRYRFKEEGEWPVDAAFSGEANTERQEDGSYPLGLEAHLILSKDFIKPWNLTFNIGEEFFPSGLSSSTDLSFGTRYNIGTLLGFGGEFKYNLSAREGSIIPQMWFQPTKSLTLKSGYSIGLDDNHANFFRLALELEFETGPKSEKTDED